ncbi:MAG: flagellar hook capping FlgD N-terminal domain-containing protein [Verrucomicrobiota bacterium]
MNVDTSTRTLANSFETPAPAGPSQNIDPSGAEFMGRKPNRTLNQDDFFKLIAAQFSYQDPLNPQKDTDFIAQMAQFNTLDQTRLMQADLSGLRTQFKGLQANQFLGQWVSLKDPATKATIEGTVTEVRFNGGEPQVVVGDVPYDLSRVTLMRSPDAPVVAPVNPGSNAGAPSAPSIPVSPNQLKILPEKMGQILGSILQ